MGPKVRANGSASVLGREATWAAAGAVLNLWAARTFLVKDPDDYCNAEFCMPVYIVPPQWWAWLIVAIVGATVVLVVRRLVRWLRSPAQAG